MGALVDGRAPQGGVAFAVGRVGGVGCGGVDGQVVGVDLDLAAKLAVAEPALQGGGNSGGGNYGQARASP